MSESCSVIVEGTPKIVTFFGNILLDMVAPGVPLDYLKKYGLSPNSTTLAEERHFGIFKDLLDGPMKKDVSFMPGGCAANSARVAQWILGGKGSSVLLSAVGDDEDALKLTQMLEESGVVLRCQKSSRTGDETGKCAVLIDSSRTGRTLVTKLGASVNFSHEKFLESGDLRFIEDNANVIYISGFFLPVSLATVRAVVTQEYDCGIPVVLNLNAVWIVNSHYREIHDILPHVNFVIGNIEEVRAFAKATGYSSNDIVNIAKSLSISPKMAEVDKVRTIIVTDGPNPIVVARGGITTTFLPKRIPDCKIVDTNGAGDAFAGGFVAALSKQCSLNHCINFGILASAEVIQQTGCNFPKEKLLCL